MPLWNLQVTHPYQPPRGTPCKRHWCSPTLITGTTLWHFSFSTELMKVYAPNRKEKDVFSLPDLHRFLAWMAIFLRLSPNHWENYMLMSPIFYPDFFFLSVYENHRYRGLQLDNHLEMFPVRFWASIWLLALVIQAAEPGNHTFPNT